MFTASALDVLGVNVATPRCASRLLVRVVAFAKRSNHIFSPNSERTIKIGREEERCARGRSNEYKVVVWWSAAWVGAEHDDTHTRDLLARLA